MPPGLLAAIDSAVHSAGQIRDRFSPDGWLALTDLRKTSRNFAARVQPGDDATRAMTVLLRKLAGVLVEPDDVRHAVTVPTVLKTPARLACPRSSCSCTTSPSR